MKRGIDHSWEVREYLGDIAWYARCKCGFEYACSKSKRNNDGTWSVEQEIDWLAHYCPNCGARKKWYNLEIIKINKYRF